MTVYAYASRSHYADHMRGIYDALPESERGGFFGKTNDPWNTGRTIPTDGFVMVASDVDSRRFPRHRVIYVEHGAGQVYRDTPENALHGSYSGGQGHGNTVLFISPSETVADRWRNAYPKVPAVAVGCAKLDPYLSRPRRVHPESGGTVVFTFHWQNPLCPESMSALPHYQRDLPAIVGALRGRGWRVLGHGHPRAMKHLSRVWQSLSVPVVEDFGYVLDHADVLVCDNSSAMYEAAAVGIHQVALNCPSYRRDVHHGLRFWDTIPGRQVHMPDAVVLQIERAHDDESEALRKTAVAATYAYTDGKSAARAADAIMRVVG